MLLERVILPVEMMRRRCSLDLEEESGEEGPGTSVVVATPVCGVAPSSITCIVPAEPPKTPVKAKSRLAPPPSIIVDALALASYSPPTVPKITASRLADPPLCIAGAPICDRSLISRCAKKHSRRQPQPQ